MSELWNETAGEGFADKALRLLKKGTVTYTGTIPYVRLDAVQDVLEALQASMSAETDEWIAKAFPDGGLAPETCPDCMHIKHSNSECVEFVGYDHINGDHECGCVGEQRCDFDCSYCHDGEDADEDEIADWYDDHDAITGELRPGIVKGQGPCTCLAPGMNYCEVHD